MFELTKKEEKLLRSLKTPQRIQDYLEALPMNQELNGDTCMSPRRVMREQKAHCIEGALLAALALRMHGHKPLVLDLTSTQHDFDHVVAPFYMHNAWGAISKTNHAVLRYREPVYKSIRELVMSYFHEYFLNDGTKTLRSYSMPINVKRFDRFGWITAEEDIWYIPNYLADAPHKNILTRAQIRTLRKADLLERKAGLLVKEHPKK